MAIDPTSRGIETETKETKAVKSPVEIVKVVSSSPGSLVVEMDDGEKYKFEGGTMSWRTRNPGNVKYGPFAASHGAVGKAHNGNAVFPTLEMGRRAMMDLLFGSESRYREMSIKKAISIYAPDYDGNDPEKYAEFISKHAKLSLFKVLKTMDGDERNRMIKAMMTFEGNKVGKLFKLSTK